LLQGSAGRDDRQLVFLPPGSPEHIPGLPLVAGGGPSAVFLAGGDTVIRR
jgi:hypothetical protein